MPVRRFALIAVLALALTAALSPAVPASAGAPTRIVVSLKFPAFHGTLRSPKVACRQSRTIKVYRERSGPDKVLGTDKSKDGGGWSVPLGNRLTSGAYYVRASATGGCRGAKSMLLNID